MMIWCLAGGLLLLATAVPAPSVPGLYMSNGTHILCSEETSSLASSVSFFSQEQGRIVGLAVDSYEDYVFWSDVSVSKKGIWRGLMSLSNTLQDPHRIVESDMFEVNGLTVDWVSQHIYWTDGRKSTVEVANYDGSNRHILSIHGLQSPRGIVVDPVGSFLYWNDQGSRKIERSRLDGSDRKTIFTVDAGHRYPNQMALHGSKLYWVDAYSKELWECESDGKQAKKTASLKAVTDDSNVFGLTFSTSGQALVSVWSLASIISVKVDGSDLKTTGLTLLGSNAVFSLAYHVHRLQPAGTSACDSYGCSHVCLLKDKTTPRCACPSFGGLALDSDMKNCRQPSNGMLLYALADEGIVGFIDPEGATTTDRFLVGRSLRPVAVAYDPVHQVVYWSDVYEHTVHQANFDGTNHKIFLRSSTHSIGVVDGMVVDAKHGRLYYSNMGTTHVNGMAYTWHRIDTIKFDGTGRRTVVTRAEKPRGLAIDADRNHLYYTTWGRHAAVVRVNLDGTEPLVVLQNMDNPNGVAIGPGDKLYVVDSHDKTQRANDNYPRAKQEGALYVKNATSLNEKPGLSLEVPFGLAVASDKIYISDWGRKAILSVSGGIGTPVMADVTAPMALFFTPVTKTVDGDTCASSDCKDVCLAKLSGTSCTCNSYKPKILQTDSKTCNVPSKFLLFADMGSIKMMGLDGTGDKSVYTLVQGNGYFSNFVAIAYNPATSTVYYSGVDRGKIYSVPLDGSAQPSVFYSTGHVIDGLALDSANSRLYWTDYTSGEIAYKELSGNNNSTVFLSGDQKRKPRAVIEHQGYIYWTEWGDKARVARKSVSSGSVESILQAANAAGLDQINGLSITNNKLYIGNASGHVYESKLDGSDVKLLSYITASHIYSLYAENNFLWYTDWKESSLSRVNLETGHVEALATGLMRPSEVIVHYGQDLTRACPSGQCQETCKLVPNGYECGCPDGKILKPNKIDCEPAVVIYVEVPPSQCAGIFGGVQGNKVCGRKIGSTDVKVVCKAGHGGTNCDACPQGNFKLGPGNEDCVACGTGSTASGTGNSACKCSGSTVWNWKTNQCSESPGTCPVISMHDDSICTSSSCSTEGNCGNVGQKCCPVAGCGATGNKHCVNPVGLTECVYNGAIYQVGATFSPNPCTKCRCDLDKTYGDHRYGNAVCSTTDCPVLNCPSGNPVKVSGQCCPVCKAPDKCPPMVTETVTVSNKIDSRCVPFKPDWAEKSRSVCWTNSNSHEQIVKFIFPGLPEPCGVKVIVVDETSPTILCPQDQTQYTSEDKPLTLTFAQPKAEDNVAVSEIKRTSRENNFPVGKTTKVVFTATDKAGNKAECSFTVTVKRQAPEVKACVVPRPTHGMLTCNDKLSCNLTCNLQYILGPGSGVDPGSKDNYKYYKCAAGSWKPAFKDSFTNLACVLRKKQVVTVSVTFRLTVEADKVVFLKASLKDYIHDKFLVNSHLYNHIRVSIIIKGQDRRLRTKRATRQMDVTVEFYIELENPDDKREEDRARQELDKIGGDLKQKLSEDIKENKVKLDPDGNNDGITVAEVEASHAEVGCLPGEQKIENYCVVCPVGTFYESVKKRCVLCDKNQYQELEGQTQCRSCPARTTSQPGSYIQAQCIAVPVEVSTPSSFPIAVIAGAVAGVVILLIIIIVIVVVCKRRSSSEESAPRGQAHTNEAYYMQPIKGKEEGEYEDIPADHAPEPPKNESPYEGLAESRKEEPNVYAKVQK